MAIIGNREFFKGINEIKFEGKDSKNPLAFKYYNPEQIVAGKSMKDHFKFAVAYWHSFCGQGADPFGAGTQNSALAMSGYTPGLVTNTELFNGISWYSIYN